MRKFVILSILLVFTFVGFGQKNKGFVVTYDLNFAPYKDAPDIKEFRSYKLYVDDTHSIYLEENLIYRYLLNDSEYEYAGQTVMNTGYREYYDSHIIQKDKETFLFVKRHPGYNFEAYTAKKMTSGDWQMTADTATVAGVLCMKATTTLGGRDWTAWFSTEIPISDGPYKFSGLPGLIMKISSDDGDYDFEIRNIEKLGPDNYFIHMVNNYNLNTQEKFEELFNLRVTNPYLYNNYKNTIMAPDDIVTIAGKKMTVIEYSEVLKKENANINTIEKFQSKK